MSWADLQAELNSSDAKNSAPVVPRLDMQRLDQLASIADEPSMPPPGAEVMMEQSQKITTALTRHCLPLPAGVDPSTVDGEPGSQPSGPRPKLEYAPGHL